MGNWEVESVTRDIWGLFRVEVRPPGATNATDVTFYRNVPVELGEYTSADPFGDATFSMNFPQITAFDDIGTGDLWWLREWAAVDIWCIRKQSLPWHKHDNERVKLWEGHIASLEIVGSEEENSVSVQCQGALFQLDLYSQLTQYLENRVPIESLIKEAFTKSKRPHLRTTDLEIRFPSDWSIKDGHGNNITGFYSRDTGSNGQKPLTGWIQTSLLPLMQHDDQAVYKRWTLLQEPNRHPVLQLRDITTVDYTIDCGAPGVSVNLSRDGTQNTNIVFGMGTDTGGNEWQRFRITPDGSRTDYEPLSSDSRVYPIDATNKSLDTTIFRVESYVNYGSGFDETAAVSDATKIISREKNAGYTGTITIKSDPQEISRFEMRAGKNLLLRYFAGTGIDGTLFHIAQVSVAPSDGTVTLTVDTKARDLLTLEEVISRSRDAHTPSRLLRAGAESQFQKDIYAPWSYSAGCGFLSPFNKSPVVKDMFLKRATKSDVYPYTSLLQRFPPRRYPEYYVKINANATDYRQRWSKGQMLVNHSGTVRRIEFVLVDANGNRMLRPFHVSAYNVSGIGYASMPRGTDGGVYKISPFIPGAFSRDTSLPDYSNFKVPDPSFIIGWGDGDQKAGFWPGLESNDGPPTGQLVDEGAWTYDLTNDISSNQQLKALRTMYFMFYAENSTTYPITEPCYIIGRMYKGIEGT